LYVSLKEAFPYVYFTHRPDTGSFLYFASQRPLVKYKLRMTQEDTSLWRQFQQTQDYQLNTLDHQVLKFEFEFHLE